MKRDRLSKSPSTKVVRTEGQTSVLYHGSPVVEFDDDIISLRTHGKPGYMTMMRLNQAAGEFGLGYSVARVGGQLFVEFADEIQILNEEITLRRALVEIL